MSERGYFWVFFNGESGSATQYDFEHFDYHIGYGGVLHITHYPNGYEERDTGYSSYRIGGEAHEMYSPNGGYTAVKVNHS